MHGMRPQKNKRDDVELYPECFVHSKRIIEGLKSINIVCSSSGIGQGQNAELARVLFRTAMNYRHDVFSPSQKAELEGWVRSSKALKVIIEEKERAKAGGTKPVAAPAAEASQSAGTNRSKVLHRTYVLLPVPTDQMYFTALVYCFLFEFSCLSCVLTILSNCTMTVAAPLVLSKEGKASATDRGRDEDKATSAQPPGDSTEQQQRQPMEEEAVPPPPPRPPSDGDAPPPLPADPPPPGSFSQPVSRPAAGSAFKFKIVVESTAADIRKAALVKSEVADEPAFASGSKRTLRDERAPSPDSSRGAKRFSRTDFGNDRDSGPAYRDSFRGERDGGGGFRDRDNFRGDRDGGSGFRDRDEGGWPRDGPYRGAEDGRRDSGFRGQERDPYGRFREREPQRGGADGDGPYGRGRPMDHDGPRGDMMQQPPVMPPAPESPMSADLGGDAHLPLPPPIGSGEAGTSSRPRRGFQDFPPAGQPGDSLSDLPAAEVPALLQRGRLVLVLDLDQMLLSSARFTELDSDMEQLLQGRMAAEAAAKLHENFQPELFRIERLGLWVKLRPSVRDFLRRTHDKFELWAHTSSGRAYADSVLELLDPHGALFGGRVTVQGGSEAEGTPSAMASQRLLAALEARGSATIILDEGSAVWPPDRRNLFASERYAFFPNSRKRFGMKGKSLLEINRCAPLSLIGSRNPRSIPPIPPPYPHRDECPDRGMLVTAGNVLERIHSLAFMYLKQPHLAQQQPLDTKLQPW